MLSLDDAVADELELDEAPELHELRDAFLFAERGAIRARSPIEATEGRTPRPSGSRLAARRRSSYPRVPAGSGTSFQLTMVGGQLVHRLGGERVRVERGFSSVGSAGADVVEGGVQPAQVLLPSRRHDVQPVGDLLGSLHDATEAADHDVGDTVPIERLQEAVGVELRRDSATRRAPCRA